VDVLLADDLMVGPLRALASPGHAPDHFALVAGRVCFCGDAVLGEGSVFITPHPGALAGYLSALERLRSLELDVLCPGHGPPIWEPAVKLGEYIEHRRERERALLEALAQGWRSSEELLDWAWADVPVHMRPLAVVTLAAHLDKLAEEDRLPAGVPRPKPPPWLSGLEP
jgi:glyoxylase-like metal-dependent hydrolase (beta-lactamase superfamily II)